MYHIYLSKTTNGFLCLTSIQLPMKWLIFYLHDKSCNMGPSDCCLVNTIWILDKWIIFILSEVWKEYVDGLQIWTSSSSTVATCKHFNPTSVGFLFWTSQEITIIIQLIWIMDYLEKGLLPWKTFKDDSFPLIFKDVTKKNIVNRFGKKVPHW